MWSLDLLSFYYTSVILSGEDVGYLMGTIFMGEKLQDNLEEALEYIRKQQVEISHLQAENSSLKDTVNKQIISIRPKSFYSKSIITESCPANDVTKPFAGQKLFLEFAYRSGGSLNRQSDLLRPEAKN